MSLLIDSLLNVQIVARHDDVYCESTPQHENIKIDNKNDLRSAPFFLQVVKNVQAHSTARSGATSFTRKNNIGESMN